MNRFIITVLTTVLISYGCGNESLESNEVVENEEEVVEESTEESSIEDEYVKPEELAKSISDELTVVEYVPSNQTFLFMFSPELMDHYINENNQYYSNLEYEAMIEEVTKEYTETFSMIYDYYGPGYSMKIVPYTDTDKTLLLIKDEEVVENNLDLRIEEESKFASELDEEQYKLLGDYINIDYRSYVEDLEEITEKNYNYEMTIDEYIQELDNAYSELEYVCRELLLSKDTEETLSDNMSKLASNAYLSCSSLKMTHFELMLNTTSNSELDLTQLKESQDYFKLAKEAYEEYQ